MEMRDEDLGYFARFQSGAHQLNLRRLATVEQPELFFWKNNFLNELNRATRDERLESESIITKPNAGAGDIPARRRVVRRRSQENYFHFILPRKLLRLMRSVEKCSAVWSLSI